MLLVNGTQVWTQGTHYCKALCQGELLANGTRNYDNVDGSSCPGFEGYKSDGPFEQVNAAFLRADYDFFATVNNIISMAFLALCFQTLVIVPFALNEELDSLFKEEEEKGDDEKTEEVGTCVQALRAVGLVNIKGREVMEERLGFMTKRFRRKNKKWQLVVSHCVSIVALDRNPV